MIGRSRLPGLRATLGDQRGMTLIEVAVSATVLAVLGSLSYGVVYTTITTQVEAQAIQGKHHAGRVALERMKRELTMAFVSLHQAEDERTQTLFIGEADSITFNTGSHEPLKRDARQSDQLEVEYSVKRVDRDGRLIDALMRRVKFHIDDRPGEGGREEVLVEGVRKLELDYFDEIRERWQSDWDVIIDDAVEMRERLKQVQNLREEAEELRTSDSGSGDLAAGAAEVAMAAAADEFADEAELELMDGLFLPSRVRIRLTLYDEEADYEFMMESQVEITMTDPLWY